MVLLLLRVTICFSQDGVRLLEKGRHLLSKIPDSTVWYANQALVLSEKNNDFQTAAKAFTLLGEAYQAKSESALSVEHYLRAINLCEQYRLDTLIGSALNGLGITYYYINDLEKSEYYIRRAADAKLKVKDYTFYSVVLTNLAGIMFYKERYDDAIALLKGAETKIKEANQEKYLASLYNSLGGAYQMKSAHPDSVLYYYLRSIEIASKWDLRENLITGYHNLGEFYFRGKEYVKSIANLRKALQLSEDGGRDRYTLALYSTLSEVYFQIGEFVKAYEMKSKELQLVKKINEAEKMRSIEELEISYQTRKREQELREQELALQASRLESERYKSRLYLIVLISLLVILGLLWFVFYQIQKRRLNQQIVQEKSKLFENIVHEIRTPLTLIQGPLQLIKKEVQQMPGGDKNLQLIEANAARLIRLVNELLDASKMEKGGYAPEHKTGDVGAMIHTIVGSFYSEAGLTKATFEIVLSSPTMICTYPSNVLEKALNNIVGNAVKFGGKGANIRVEAELVENKLVVSVSDDGPGIPAGDRDAIFTRFFRGVNGKKQSGTGIGLAFTKELLELYGGKIWFESPINGGAKFSFELPVSSISSTEEVQDVVNELPVLLVAEDDPQLLGFVRDVFSSEYNIITVSNGEDAIRLVQERIPDVVLSDIMMPGKDGLEVLRQCKTDDLTAHIPVVLFSSKNALQSKLDALQLGADAYVAKPFHPDELRYTIHNLLELRRKSQQQAIEDLRKSDLPVEDRLKSKNEFVNKAITFIMDHLSDGSYSVNELASDLCLSRSQLHRKITAFTGQSATHFIRMVRLEKSREFLASGKGNFTEVAYLCGFSSHSYFSRSYAEHFGHSPSQDMP